MTVLPAFINANGCMAGIAFRCSAVATAEPLVDRAGIANFHFAFLVHLLDRDYVIPCQCGQFADPRSDVYRRRRSSTLRTPGYLTGWWTRRLPFGRQSPQNRRGRCARMNG